MKLVLFKFLSNIYSFFENAYHFRLYSSYREKYDIHESFSFNGEKILMYGDGKIVIEANSYIGRYSILQVSLKNKIIIGKNCRIGPFFTVWTQSSEVDEDFNFTTTPKSGDIILGDAVWIGAHVFISPGVTIGHNSIIGANSVVTKDVPSFAIVGGVPAKIIRYKNIKKNYNL